MKSGIEIPKHKNQFSKYHIKPFHLVGDWKIGIWQMLFVYYLIFDAIKSRQRAPHPAGFTRKWHALS